MVATIINVEYKVERFIKYSNEFIPLETYFTYIKNKMNKKKCLKNYNELN